MKPTKSARRGKQRQIKTCFIHKWNFKRQVSIKEVDDAMKMKWKYVRAKGRVETGKIKKVTKSCTHIHE